MEKNINRILILTCLALCAVGCKKKVESPVIGSVQSTALDLPCNPFKGVSRIYVFLDYEDGSTAHFSSSSNDLIELSENGVIKLPMKFKRTIEVKKEISCGN